MKQSSPSASISRSPNSTPSNPVDFEQREGRVDRYRGHAIRRNIMAQHGVRVLADGAASPWSAAYRLASANGDPRGGLSPDWIYPGPITVERNILPYPLSVDEARLARIKSDLALYRLTFGQPRQEDLVTILRGRRLAQTTIPRTDLTPPS